MAIAAAKATEAAIPYSPTANLMEVAVRAIMGAAAAAAAEAANLTELAEKD